MATTIVINYCITSPSKRFAVLQNKSFRHFMTTLLNSSLKRNNIWIRSCFFLFSKTLFIVIFWPFDPAKNVIPRWCTRRRWHILMAVVRGNRVGGNWLMKWDELKKFPWYTHRLTHRKRVTCELHNSYFCSMTITQAIPKIAEVTHPDRQISEEIAEAWRRGGVSISPRGSLKVI